MLPPVESNVLVANPKFEALYHNLCANKLDENGPTKLDVKAQKEREALQEKLYRTRLDGARRDVIRANLQDLAYRDDALPDDLRELVALAAAVLGGEISDEDKELVNGELERLSVNTSHLHREVGTLGQLLGTDRHLSFNNIPTAIQQLKTKTTTSRSQLSHSRLALAQNTQHLHELHRQVLETSIRVLEQTIHGSVARGTKAKADYQATVAEGMSKKLSLQHAQLLQQVYSPGMQEALRARADSMQRESAVLRTKIRDAEHRLDEYRSSREVQGMVKKYAEIVRESEKVKEEIVRLEKR
ncbi:hypothetical protein B0A55_04880 [Friedmanniomyces simplex]|uniref:Uncharacterized protein n=1 Tax=Friedmanniomyces simplex TaxID=329884 RepID=A0A4U0XJ73_9PEZI|nr:hypothetical protein B0A55_04880 [Friedmanniomyces simplex]